MRTIYLLITFFLLVEVGVAIADQDGQTNSTDSRDSKDFDFTDSSLLIDDESPELQRRRDFGNYYSRPNRYSSGSYRGPSGYTSKGRYSSRPHSPIRPFKTYGPPNHGNAPSSPGSDRPAFNNFLNQDMPNPLRQVEFVEKSPIASQNDLPFGRNTANYLPPRNQKLPAPSPPYLFSNQNHDFPRFRQPTQPQAEQFFQPSQAQQFQSTSQNFNGPDFNRQNFGPPQNSFQTQQISDAALFLTQNAQAISSLYGAPAPNQNYAPYNQDFSSNNPQFGQIDQSQFQPINQPSFNPSQQISQPAFNQQIRQEGLNQQLSQPNFNEQSNPVPQVHAFQGHIPSYASGILSPQEAQGNLQALERERLIAQLQQALSSRENAARAILNANGNGNPVEGANVVPTSQLLPIDNSNQFNPPDPSFDQSDPSFIPTPPDNSHEFQGYYVASTPATTPASIATTPPPSISTTYEPTLDISGTGNSQIGVNSFPHDEARPDLTQGSGVDQYRGFLPSFVPSAFVPSNPIFGTTLIPTTGFKPSEDGPTHFVLPLPGSQGQQKPANPPSNFNPVSLRPPNHPSTPSISLGPVSSLVPPIQTVTSRPGSGLVPVAPVFGSQLPALGPPLVFKPGKVYPVYYYPNFPYQATQRSTDTAATQAWNYAPNFAQRRRGTDS